MTDGEKDVEFHTTPPAGFGILRPDPNAKHDYYLDDAQKKAQYIAELVQN